MQHYSQDLSHQASRAEERASQSRVISRGSLVCVA